MSKRKYSIACVMVFTPYSLDQESFSCSSYLSLSKNVFDMSHYLDQYVFIYIARDDSLTAIYHSPPPLCMRRKILCKILGLRVFIDLI